MYRKYTTYIILASVLFLGLIGVGLKKNSKTDTAYLDQAPKFESEVNLKSNESDSISKLSTMPTEAEKKIAYAQSLLAVLPASLKGVPSPAPLDVDTAGNLVINAKIRKMFDHYLSTVGEEDISKTIDRIKLLLDRQLSDPALAQALNIFDAYIEYKEAMDGILQQSAKFQSGQYDAQTIASVKQQIRLERHNHFASDVIAAFFAREDQYDDYMLARSQIANNKTLSSDEKDAEMSRLNTRSPAWLAEQGIKTNKIDAYKAKEKNLLESGAQDWEIKDFRRRELGEDSAAKLELRDQRRADWSQRLSTYQEAVRQAMTQYDDPEAPDAIAKRDQIRAEHFKDNELRRVISLDAVK